MDFINFISFCKGIGSGSGGGVGESVGRLKAFEANVSNFSIVDSVHFKRLLILII